MPTKFSGYTLAAAELYKDRPIGPVRQSIIDLMQAMEQTEQRMNYAIEIIILAGTTDGAQHKQWALDQVLRLMVPAETYQQFRNSHPDWSEGVVP